MTPASASELVTRVPACKEDESWLHERILQLLVARCTCTSAMVTLVLNHDPRIDVVGA